MRLPKFCQSFLSLFIVFTLLLSSTPLETREGKTKKSHSVKSEKKKGNAHKRKKIKSSEDFSIDDFLKSKGLSKAGISIQVISLKTGKVLFDHHPDRTVNPASNVKIVTEAAALRNMGADYTFKTEFYSDTLMKNGRIHHLWIKGNGDPVFVTEELDAIIDQWIASGLKEITGNVYVDDTYFDRYNLTTYMAEEGSQEYKIVNGPLSFNFNSIIIRATPAKKIGDHPTITTDPPSKYFTFKNEASTTAKGKRGRIIASNDKSKDTVITIKGNIPKTIREYSIRQGILDPATFTGTMILEALQRKGVRVEGGVQREAVPAKAINLLTHSSPPLREVLKSMGKFSNNFTAEQMIKSVGAVRYGPPGSTEKGVKAVQEYLHTLDIPNSTYSIDTGSGLSRHSRFSAEQMNKILIDLYHSPLRDDFIHSLSQGGVDGTLRHRMKSPPLYGNVYAKTGTLNDVTALSGYVLNSGNDLVFSILFQDFKVPVFKIYEAEEFLLESMLTKAHEAP